jgi:hypothetical protein
MRARLFILVSMMLGNCQVALANQCDDYKQQENHLLSESKRLLPTKMGFKKCSSQWVAAWRNEQGILRQLHEVRMQGANAPSCTLDADQTPGQIKDVDTLIGLCR